jgi:threonine synthase
VLAAPEGGAAWAGLLELTRRGWIRRGERVCVFNTGSGHKYVEATRAALSAERAHRVS